MEIPRHWRLKKIRLGVASEWAKILERYRDKELNPHLSLAHYASDLSEEELSEIHDRKASQEQVLFERKK